MLKEIIVYQTENGKEPYYDWVKSLKDKKSRDRISVRLRRVEQGNYGDFKSLKDGIYELRLFFGSGYRIYFGEDGDKIIILLCGGDKSTQSQDIEKAKEYWRDYNEKL